MLLRKELHLAITSSVDRDDTNGFLICSSFPALRRKRQGKGFGCTAVAVEAQLHVMSCTKVHSGMGQASCALNVLARRVQGGR